MTLTDQCVLILTIWRENRGGGIPGMQSCANVILNRSAAENQSVAWICLDPDQFSSMTEPGNPELANGPNALSAADWQAYLQAILIASEAAASNLPDLTGGAQYYFADSIPPPSWAAGMVKTADIAGQSFYRPA